MEEKNARLTFLIDPQNKEAFDAICASRDETSSEVLRQLIMNYLALHGTQLPAANDEGGGEGPPV